MYDNVLEAARCRYRNQYCEERVITNLGRNLMIDFVLRLPYRYHGTVNGTREEKRKIALATRAPNMCNILGKLTIFTPSYLDNYEGYLGKLCGNRSGGSPPFQIR